MYNNLVGVLEDKLKLLPDNPGVYVMLDADGQIIYVGKAKNLKNRVRQYFFNSVKTEKVMAMVRNIADFYYIIAPTEIDALSLEDNLIKKHKPRYNILLKDDKTYPYLKVNLKDEFPCFTVTRKIKKDGAKYFGPYMGGINVSGVAETLNLVFGVRPCDKKLNSDKPIKPCLNYHIKRCSAPCAGLISREEYLNKVRQAIDFLSGDTAFAEKTLKSKMIKASENEDFELAVKYRDNLVSLDKLKQKRITSLGKYLDADVIAYAENGIYSAVSLLVIRKGRMLGARNYSFENATDGQEALSEFIRRYYTTRADVPDEIITPREIPDGETLEKFIFDATGKRTEIIFPKLGIRKQLTDMAVANATEHLETAIGKIKHKNDMTVSACKRLKEILGLKNYPKRMECYDISNISGVDKVGSMVVFNDGEKDAESYRRFKIKTVEGANDFESLKEVLKRRLDRMVTDPKKFPKPDLVVIDGGKGQLSSVKEVFDEKGVTDIDLISLAKREEEIFTVGSKIPVVLDKRDYSLRMLQRIRDEAHRFAITFHRNLRDKRESTSVLSRVKGLGKKKISALLAEFKDIGNISQATEEELKKVNGIGEKEAQEIIKVLSAEGLR